MHIVLANQWFYPEVGGGVGKYNWMIARAYRALGHAVTVIAKSWNADLPAYHEVKGIRVHRLRVADAYYLRRLPGVGRYARSIQQINYSRRINKLLRQLHKQGPIDVVEFAEVNAEGFAYARSPQAPVVVRCHTPSAVLARHYDRAELGFDGRLTAFCEKDSIRHAHALTAPSADMARVVAKLCGLPVESISVIPNPLSVNGSGARPVSNSVNGSVTILHVGRLDRAKGVAVLANAIPRVAREVPQARFVFIGGDRPTPRGTSQRAELEDVFTKAGVQEKVSFQGSVDESTLEDWYHRADICVVPSMLYESFSYTSAEAMVAGKPVVASQIGGIPETVLDGVTGLLVTPGNVNELADAIIRLASDAGLRTEMGAAGRDRVAREFDPLRIARRNLEVYEYARTRFEQIVGSRSV